MFDILTSLFIIFTTLIITYCFNKIDTSLDKLDKALLQTQLRQTDNFLRLQESFNDELYSYYCQKCRDCERLKIRLKRNYERETYDWVDSHHHEYYKHQNPCADLPAFGDWIWRVK